MRPEELIASLNDYHVRYVIVGGFAAILQGANYVTQDIDFCYAREPENLEQLFKALSPFHPIIRPNPKLEFNLTLLQENENFTLETEAGEVDLLANIDGLGDYAEVEKYADTYQIQDQDYLVLSLEGLITSKNALKRRKDLQLLEELRTLLALREEENK